MHHEDLERIHRDRPQAPAAHEPPSTPTPRLSKLRLRPEASRRTHPLAWCVAACCAVLSLIVILGGLAVLIVYLVFRPRSPRLEISGATLNGAYLDMGVLLNADVTILANVTNPNHKVDVSFSYVQLDLYFNGTMVATQAVEPFSERRGESALQSLHMVTSQVALSREKAAAWRSGAAGDGLAMEVKAYFRTRSDFGSWLHFTYWLHGHCNIIVGAPPNGVLLASHCRTKRSG